MSAFKIAKQVKHKRVSVLKQKESEIQKGILKFLNLNGIFAFTVKTQGTFDPTRRVFRKNPQQMKGVSDILGIVDGGRLLAIEVKRPKCYATPEQKLFMQTVNDNGGLAFLARSVEDVIAAFELEKEKQSGRIVEAAK